MRKAAWYQRRSDGMAWMGQRGGAAHSLAELSVRTIRFGRVVEQRSELREQQCLLRCHSRLPHSTTQRRRHHG